jgi:hypothetical protein
MSISNISQSNELGVDVLLMIFQQLEGEDLLKCAKLCVVRGVRFCWLGHRGI